MLKKSYRLTQKEFACVWASGRRQHSEYFTIVTSPADRCKVAVVVGKKAAKTAVLRNRLRRQVYGVVEEILCTQECRMVCIIVIKKPYVLLADSKKRQELTAELARILKLR